MSARANPWPVNDIDVRRVLRGYLAGGGHHVIEELGLHEGACRIDLAVVSPTSLAGFEIKSDKDTLVRLERQQRMYSKVLDRITLVSGSKHLDKAVDAVPSWWGVVEASFDEAGKLRLRGVRDAGWNPAIDPRALVQLLWRDEMWKALRQRHLGRGLSGAPRWKLAKMLADEVDLDELRKLVRETLVTRENWRRQPAHWDPEERKPPHKRSERARGRSRRRH